MMAITTRSSINVKLFVCFIFPSLRILILTEMVHSRDPGVEQGGKHGVLRCSGTGGILAVPDLLPGMFQHPDHLADAPESLLL